MMRRRMGGSTDWRMVVTIAFLSVYPTIRPSVLYAQCPDGSPPPCRVQPARVAPPPTSLAVLYFDNLSPDTADAYLADGLTEEMIARLGGVDRLTVKSRTSVHRFRGHAASDPVMLGRTLGVAHLVSGSVRRAGTRLRVSVELVRAATGTRLWGQQYDRTDADLLAIEEDIATAVATAIAGQLLPTERQALAARPSADPAAYALYLKGRFEFNRFTPAAAFRSAIQADSLFAAAYAGLADAYNWLADYQPPSEMLPEMRAAALQAIALEPTSAEALTALAGIQFWFDWDVTGAERTVRRAIALRPGYPFAHLVLGLFLVNSGRHEEGVAVARRGVELDSIAARARFLDILFEARRFEEAVAASELAVRDDPTLLMAHIVWGRALSQRGRFAEGIAHLRQALALYPGDPVVLAILGSVYGQADSAQAIRAILGDLRARARVEYVPAAVFAALYAALAEPDSAFAWLDHAVVDRSAWVPHLLADPLWDPLRIDPRFSALLRRTGLRP